MKLDNPKETAATTLQWTHVEPVSPSECGKVFLLDEDGNLARDDIPWLNSARLTVCKGDLDEFLGYLAGVKPGHATIYGVPKDLDKLDENGCVLAYSRRAKSALQADRAEAAITRTLDDIAFPASNGLMMLDNDPAPGSVPMTVDAFYDMINITLGIPGGVEMVVGNSSNSHIFNDETGEELKGAGGVRAYVAVEDATDIPRAGAILAKRLWLAGHGWIEISAAGSFLIRSPVDIAVWDASRLDFTGGAICRAPLVQRRPDFEILTGDASKTMIDTRAALPDLTDADEKKYQDLITKAKEAKEDEAAEVRAAWIEAQLEKAAKAGMPEHQHEDRAAVAAAVEELRSTPLAARLWAAVGSGDGGRLPADFKCVDTNDGTGR